MITIDQLLESVDLDFEPRFVTKDKSGLVSVWEQKPEQIKNLWYNGCKNGLYSHLKLAEFYGKDWTECIYEVPRKMNDTKLIGKLCKFWDSDETDKVVGTLEGTQDNEYRFIRLEGFAYMHCEPVRPDDDMIYKGE